MKLFLTFISEEIPHLTPVLHHIAFSVDLDQFPSALSPLNIPILIHRF